MKYPDGDSDLKSLKKKKSWNLVGVCLWILLPTNECVARRCHICPPHCKPGLPAAGPLERECHRPNCTGSASPVGEKVAIANELDQRFSSCLQAIESPYSAIPPPLQQAVAQWGWGQCLGEQAGVAVFFQHL